MSETLIVLLVLAGAALLAMAMAYAAIRVAKDADRESFHELLEALKGPQATKPLPVAEAPPFAPPVRTQPMQTVTLRLVSGKGRFLRNVTIPRGARRPIYQTRIGTELSTFVADRCEDGQWIYRRVGVERES